MPNFGHLVSGFRTFHATEFERDRDLVTHLVESGLRPSTLVITSSGMHISPEKLTGSRPGELYVIRNMVGLVPPFEGEEGANGTVAAIEYAVNNLKVENILVLGHAHSVGVKLLLDNEATMQSSDPMKAWLGIGKEVKDVIEKQMGDKSREEQERACEFELIVLCLRNLYSYPWVAKRAEEGSLQLIGWHFDIETGQLLNFNLNSQQFEAIA